MTKSGNEAWTVWTQNLESMQKMLSNPAALNPFSGIIGLAVTPDATNPAAALDPRQFMKAIDPAEIERRIQDLRAVEAWMKFSLQGLEMSIKAMEMQRDAYASFSKMGEQVEESTVAAAMRSVKRAARSKPSAAARKKR